jgi:hypothetical protein
VLHETAASHRTAGGKHLLVEKQDPGVFDRARGEDDGVRGDRPVVAAEAGEPHRLHAIAVEVELDRRRAELALEPSFP